VLLLFKSDTTVIVLTAHINTTIFQKGTRVRDFKAQIAIVIVLLCSMTLHIRYMPFQTSQLDTLGDYASHLLLST
jgi:hypothetical protein